MITEKEIEQAAMEIYVPGQSFDSECNDNSLPYISGFEAGANFVLKDMDREMCLFAEWRDEQITGSWMVENDIKRYRMKGLAIIYLSTPELLQIYKNREK